MNDRYKMHFNIILLWSVFVLTKPVATILTRGPSDVFTTISSTVILPCYTNLSKAVMWQVEKVSESVEVLWYDIYQGIPGYIKSSFQERFSVSVDSTGNQYNLTITDVQMEDAGTYRCGDESGLGLQKYKQGISNYGATAELVICGNLVCSQNTEDDRTIGLNEESLDRPPHLIRMNCSLHYRGNISPNLRWSLLWNDEREESLENFTQSRIERNGADSILTSTMKIPAQRRMDRGFVRCILVTPNVDQINSGIDDQMVWNSSIIAIQDIRERRGLVTGIAACLVVISLLVIGLLLTGLVHCKKKNSNRSSGAKKSGGEESKTSDVLLAKREKSILIFGLDTGEKVEQKICQISLGKPDTFKIFNFQDNKPEEICSYSAACVVSGVMFTVGIGGARNELWMLWMSQVNRGKVEWMSREEMPSSGSGRSRHCVTSVDDKIYVLGGWDDTNETTLDSILCYNIKSDEWTEAGQLSYAVMFAACVTYKHCIYVFGGAVGKNNKKVNYVQVYDTAKRSVVLGPKPMPEKHSLMRAVLCGSKALLIGEHTCYIYDFEAINFAGRTWEKRERFKTNVTHFGLTLDHNTLYISGGGTDSTGSWTYGADVKSLLVKDFLDDNCDAEWKHHASLPIPALVHAYSTEPLLT